MLRRLALLAAVPAVLATSLSDIQGSAWQSTYAGKKVTDVEGTVTAKSDSGFWITSGNSSLQVYTTSTTDLGKVDVGDSVTLSGTVSSYRSSSQPNDLYVTELDDISTTSSSSGDAPSAIVLGKDVSPPTGQMSALDKGSDGFLSVPNNASSVEATNADLQPDAYGMDFWQSIVNSYVTVPSPVAVDFNDYYGDIYVRGDWNVLGLNSRGGLTMVPDANGLPTPHPDEILVSTPLDNTTLPNVTMGTTLSDISGVLTYQYGYFTILPTTAPKVLSSPDSTVPASNITSSSDQCTITLGDYNVENLAPNSTHMGKVADHIANYLNSPDIMFVQEIQDDSGPTDDGTVSANQTLANLVAAISSAGSSVGYEAIDVNPQNDKDGGEPGGNIRQAYLYNSKKMTLVPGSPAGGATDSTKVINGTDGKPTLSYNPGRIEPYSQAWNDSRKPLAAVWETPSGDRFFTINLQLTAKLDSSSVWGDARPPVNAYVDERTAQVKVVASFIQDILDADSNANIIMGGDCNEYLYTTSVFASLSGLVTEIDALANIPVEERYTYVYNGITEQLDHLFVSDAVKGRGVEAEHIHVNNWAATEADRASDHDPTVAQFKVC
ncbi:DNase I-like protein [Coniophora puteana RWD-64-598 SS2]|uniref:DNase I-like protein n=1 Tax=Coniophora puteana (strain RWD-64-598) TaxID=741705 RepID=A0A5M3MQ99_CONPW|nr:DNase I-like protein [Coniophora puteana RWD-64-598 SS2]EIW81349.1 DNase I-like protein [Coniophora puteana RWD-64-598 SS2]